MSILLADNFSYLGRKPLDGRILYDTLTDMAGMADSTLYEGAIAYNKETEVFYSWNSANVDDTDLGKWRPLELGGSGVGVQEYKQGTDYKKGSLFIKDGQIYVATKDFTSDDIGADDDESFENDLVAENIIAVKYMPLAPNTYSITIVNGGYSYTVGEFLAASNEPSVILEVTEVDDTGAITAVVPNLPEITPNALGSDAEINIKADLYAGNGDQWIKVELSSGDAYLLDDVVSNVTVGGINESDQVDKNTSFTDFVKKLLTKKVIPTITFTASNSGLHEIGETISTSHLKVVIGNLSKLTVPVNKIDFLVNGTIVDTETFVDGQNTYTFGYTDPITTNTTAKVIVTYEGTKTVSATADFTFVKASYYGSVDSLTPDESTILGLAKNIKASKAFTWNNANLNDARFCYAYPASMGNLSSIKDANNFEYISSYTKTTETVDGENYNIYILTDPVTISGAKQIYA